jgi:hypothetical protein
MRQRLRIRGQSGVVLVARPLGVFERQVFHGAEVELAISSPEILPECTGLNIGRAGRVWHDSYGMRGRSVSAIEEDGDVGHQRPVRCHGHPAPGRGGGRRVAPGCRET